MALVELRRKGEARNMMGLLLPKTGVQPGVCLACCLPSASSCLARASDGRLVLEPWRPRQGAGAAEEKDLSLPPPMRRAG